MPKMFIERSITIDAPASKIYKIVSDFNEWIPWSPWLLMEPEAKVEVASDAQSYTWEGARTGTGNMKILEARENEFLDFDLHFLKPWKSHANTQISLSSEGKSTKVTWVMHSQLPFFLFFMKKMMEAYVGADYERGLDMLKAYAETGGVPSQLDFEGAAHFEGTQYIGIKTNCSLDTVGTQMASDFGRLGKCMEDHGLVPEKTMSIYHKWDIPKNRVTYTALMGLKELPASIPEGMYTGTLPATPCYALKHTGRYHHLGNAWATLYTMMRNKEIKHNKKIDPFEMYLNDPSQTAEKDLETRVFMPVR